MHDPFLAFILQCLISYSAIWRCRTFYTIFNIFLYIHTHFLLIFVQKMHFRNSVPTKTWNQPSRKNELNLPRSATSGNVAHCLPQQKFWAHLAIREGSICWYMRSERGTVLSDTCAHTDTPCSTQVRGWSDLQPAALSGFVYLMQNQYPYFQDNASNILME